MAELLFGCERMTEGTTLNSLSVGIESLSSLCFATLLQSNCKISKLGTLKYQRVYLDVSKVYKMLLKLVRFRGIQSSNVSILKRG